MTAKRKVDIFLNDVHLATVEASSLRQALEEYVALVNVGEPTIVGNTASTNNGVYVAREAGERTSD